MEWTKPFTGNTECLPAVTPNLNKLLQKREDKISEICVTNQANKTGVFLEISIIFHDLIYKLKGRANNLKDWEKHFSCIRSCDAHCKQQQQNEMHSYLAYTSFRNFK